MSIAYINEHLCEPRCLQQLLGGAGAEVKQVWRPQAQDPRIDFVSYLKGARWSILQLYRSLCLTLPNK